MTFGYAWYMINFDADQENFSDNEQAIASRDLIMQCIEELCKLYDLDNKKYYTIRF